MVVANATDAERSAPSNILRQQDTAVRPCANRSRRHYGRQPVVTTREMPQPTRTYGRWRSGRPQVTSSPRVNNADRATRSATSACCGPRQPKCHLAHPEPWGNGSPRWISFQQESAIDANATCRGGERIDLGKNGSGVPGPLLFPQRSGVRDGQKHLPAMNTPATTDGYPWAINQRKDVKRSNRQFGTRAIGQGSSARTIATSPGNRRDHANAWPPMQIYRTVRPLRVMLP